MYEIYNVKQYKKFINLRYSPEAVRRNKIFETDPNTP